MQSLAQAPTPTCCTAMACMHKPFLSIRAGTYSVMLLHGRRKHSVQNFPVELLLPCLGWPFAYIFTKFTTIRLHCLESRCRLSLLGSMYRCDDGSCLPLLSCCLCDVKKPTQNELLATMGVGFWAPNPWCPWATSNSLLVLIEMDQPPPPCRRNPLRAATTAWRPSSYRWTIPFYSEIWFLSRTVYS